MEEFTISEPGVVTLHSRGRIQDVCIRLKYEENVTIECRPVHVPDASPPLSPLHPQCSRLKSVECVEGDWSFIRIDKGDIALQQVGIRGCLPFTLVNTLAIFILGGCDCEQDSWRSKTF